MRRAASILLLSIALAAPLRADEPKIERLTAISSAGRVSVRFALANAFDKKEMIEALQSGLPTSFTYTIEIFRDRPNWFDDHLYRSKVEVICTFNSVTREYLLNYRRDRKLVRSETFTDLDSLVKHMTEIDEQELFDLGERKPYKHKVRVKADLMRGWLLYVVPWEISTSWREARVKVLKAQEQR